MYGVRGESDLLRERSRHRPSLVRRHIAHASIVLRIPTAILRTPTIRVIVLLVDRPVGLGQQG